MKVRLAYGETGMEIDVPSERTVVVSPTQTQAVTSSAAPQNQASELSEVVPVLPHCPGAPMSALVPVPPETTVSRMLFASSAVSSGITCL